MSDELKAREMLAAVFDQHGATLVAKRIRAADPDNEPTISASNAIAAIVEALRGASGGGAGEVDQRLRLAALKVVDDYPVAAGTAKGVSGYREGGYGSILALRSALNPKPAPAIGKGGAVEPTEAMIDAGVAFALQVSLGGEYRWSHYVADMWRTMDAARLRAALTTERQPR